MTYKWDSKKPTAQMLGKMASLFMVVTDALFEKILDTRLAKYVFNPALGDGAIYDLGCYPLTAVLRF